MTEHSDKGTLFKSLKFTDWPTVKEALIAKDIGGVFILAPMAMQLVADGVCSDLEGAKRLIRNNLAVQVLVVADAEERTWLEHFMLAALKPRYCD